MRHGSTRGNELRQYVGRRTDEPLSAAGREQCLRAGVFPQVGIVYASPLLRAVETASICYPCARIVCVEGLEEFDFGAFEGRSAKDMEQDEEYRAWVDGGCVSRCPAGESRATFMARSNEALESLLRDAWHRCEQEVFVVAHGGTIMAAFHVFARGIEGKGDYFDWQVGPCEGYSSKVLIGEEGLVLTEVTPFPRHD